MSLRKTCLGLVLSALAALLLCPQLALAEDAAQIIKDPPIHRNTSSEDILTTFNGAASLSGYTITLTKDVEVTSPLVFESGDWTLDTGTCTLSGRDGIEGDSDYRPPDNTDPYRPYGAGVVALIVKGGTLTVTGDGTIQGGDGASLSKASDDRHSGHGGSGIFSSGGKLVIVSGTIVGGNGGEAERGGDTSRIFGNGGAGLFVDGGDVSIIGGNLFGGDGGAGSRGTGDNKPGNGGDGITVRKSGSSPVEIAGGAYHQGERGFTAEMHPNGTILQYEKFGEYGKLISIWEDAALAVTGSLAVNGNEELRADGTLLVAQGATLTNNGSIQGNGAFVNEGNVQGWTGIGLAHCAIIETAATAGGTASGEGLAEVGSPTTVSATPDDGYHFVEWTENGNQVSTEANYTFDAGGGRRTLTASFEVHTETPEWSAGQAAHKKIYPCCGAAATAEEGHSWQQGACAECGYACQHSWDTAWERDDTSHWHVCTLCGEADAKAAHAYGDWATTVEATATEPGAREKTCAACDHKITEVVPATGQDVTPPGPPSEDDQQGSGEPDDSKPDPDSKPGPSGEPDNIPSDPQQKPAGAQSPTMAQTGDSANILLCGGLLALGVGSLVTLIAARRHHKNR